MKVHHKSIVKRASILLCMLALGLFLVACSSIGGSPTTSAPPPTPTPTPTPTPPPGTSYKGDGYTLSFPTGAALSGSNQLITITDSFVNPASSFVLTTTPGTAAIDLNTLVDTELTTLKGIYSNYQQDTTLPSTASVGGDSWKQVGGTGQLAGVNIKSVVLLDQHPAAGNIYIITLTAPADSYDNVYANLFKFILDSFKFD